MLRPSIFSSKTFWSYLPYSYQYFLTFKTHMLLMRLHLDFVNETPSWISVIVLMKFVFAKEKSNLRTISSSNILKKGKSSWRKFVILIAQLLIKIKTFLFGRENMSDSKNTHILSVTIQCILSTDSFIIPLFE